MPEDHAPGIAGTLPDRFHADPERSHTLAAPYYFQPTVYEDEKTRIFYRAWNYIAHVSQLKEPLSYVAATIGDQEIFVIRAEDGTLRGFYNVCAHRAHLLLSGAGRLKSRAIVCPYHAWSYTADGRLRAARGSEGMPGFDKKDFCLTPVRVETYCGFVFATLDPEAPALAEQAGALEQEIRAYVPEIDDLVFAHRKTYEIKANWKNVVDNFLECYHCTPAHPAFVDLVDIKNYRSVCHDRYSSHISPPGRVDNKAYAIQVPEGRPTHFAAWWLWPNVTFNAFPGTPNITVLHIMPAGPERTLEHLDFFFLKPEPAPAEWEAIRYADEILQPEDIGLVESVQRGLHSHAYHQGRFIVDRERSFLSEHAVHHFHGLVLQALKA